MISAKEGKEIFLKLSKNENFNDLQNAVETYEIKSGILQGFGELTHIETEDGIVDLKEAIFFGVISELREKPHIEIYCYSNNINKIKNFVAVDFIITIKQFDEIKLYSRLNEKGKLDVSVGEKQEELK